MSPFLKTQVRIVVGTGLVMTLFQVGKGALYPRLSGGSSDIITIIFTTLLAAIVSSFALPAYERLRRVAQQARTDRDQAHGATRLAEREALLLRTAIEQAAEGVLITDPDGRIEYVNPAAAEITGYAREELLGQTPRYLKSGLHDAAFYKALWGTILGGRVWSGDITNRRKDGRLSVERTTIAPVIGESGGVTHFVALKQNVTERRRQEEALERMQYSIDHALDSVLWADAAGRLVYANETAARTLGYTPAEILALAVWDINPDVTPETWPAAWEESKKESAPTVQTRRVRRDGTIFPIEVSVSHVAFRGQEYQCVIGRDITDRQRAEEKLRASENRYRNLFERNLAGVYRSTPQGRLLECNDAFGRIYGYGSGEEILGASAFQPYASAQARAAFLEKLRREGSVVNYEFEGIRKDGKTVRILENATLVEADVIEGTLVDVTEQKLLEEQFRQAQKMEAVGRLAGGVAHDFNNLLGVIIGYSEILLGKLADTDPLREKVGQIVKAGERAAGLTRQLLAFSRQQVLQPRVVDLNLIVSDMDKMLRRVIGEDIDLTTTLDPHLGRVKADPGQLEQIIMNLVVNARDAMPDGGRLTIETHNAELDGEYAATHLPVVPGPYTMLAISDTGTGMDENVRARVFEPFFTTKERGKGTGLGLSTVYGIVKQSGGYVWVYSEVGVGTTFKVYLPRTEDIAESPSEVTPAPVLGGNETILVVEDEAALRDLLRETLEAHGYHTLVASDGAEALQIAADLKAPIHLLMTDLIMPGMTGSAVAKAMKETRPEIKVLYMSGYTDEAIVRQGGFGVGMAFLGKPFTAQDLFSKVRQVLDGR